MKNAGSMNREEGALLLEVVMALSLLLVGLLALMGTFSLSLGGLLSLYRRRRS